MTKTGLAFPARHSCNVAVALALSLLLTGCAWMRLPREEAVAPLAPVSGPRKIAIFFDGTANDQRSGTNVSELFKLATAPDNRTWIYAYYIEGVGAKGKPVGMATAWGLGVRVRKAYGYLTRHYRPGDEIYLFGFSRGAYSARILAAMLHHVGLPTPESGAGEPLSEDVVDRLYEAFKCSTWRSNESCTRYDRVSAVARTLKETDVSVAQTRVRFLGLWDTVEALGWPDFEENVDLPNSRYGDQLCNVDHAVHAVALDDNRARIFTPILLTRRHLVSECPGVDLQAAISNSSPGTASQPSVEEAYFAGAHADVGGGYDDARGQLDGVSLAWMITHVLEAGVPIVSHAHRVAQQPFAPVHDAEGEFPWNVLYRRQYRDIDAYSLSPKAASQKIKFHDCLIQRMRRSPRIEAEYGGPDKHAQKVLRRHGADGAFETCFRVQSDGTRVYEPGGRCRIERVGVCQPAD